MMEEVFDVAGDRRHMDYTVISGRVSESALVGPALTPSITGRGSP